MIDFLTALFLGLVEGLTEFIPVSSTAHLIVLVEGLRFPAPPGHVFEVFIQLGAILALVVVYWEKLLKTALGLPHDPSARRFALSLIVGTLPALLIGALAHSWIKSVLYHPHVIAVSLIAGALVIFAVERRVTTETYKEADSLPLKTALLVGICQCVALIPGVSRSGATIIGGRLLGLSRPAAAEFSFFLSIPVMFAAVAYDSYKNREALMHLDQLGLLMTGFIAAFISALIVVKFALGFISKHGFAPFAWYRLAAGAVIAWVFF